MKHLPSDCATVTLARGRRLVHPVPADTPRESVLLPRLPGTQTADTGIVEPCNPVV